MSPELFRPRAVLVQGLTGSQGSFHADRMIAYGTPVVAGVSPGKAGKTYLGVPVYASVTEACKEHPVDASVIFVPAPHAKAAVLEAIGARIPLIVCITEGIPVHDMLDIRRSLEGSGSVLIGPNCPGVLVPGASKLGIIPTDLAQTGGVGVVSRSGTLTYEAMAGLTARGLGQAYVIGIGGDPIRGTGFDDCLALFESDPAVKSIIMIGEIGGTDELVAAQYLQLHVTKPVYAYIAGHHAPAGVQLGHAGAILGSEQESAQFKSAALRESGAFVSSNIGELIDAVKAG